MFNNDGRSHLSSVVILQPLARGQHTDVRQPALHALRLRARLVRADAAARAGRALLAVTHLGEAGCGNEQIHHNRYSAPMLLPHRLAFHAADRHASDVNLTSHCTAL